jgi:hypothetical protein
MALIGTLIRGTNLSVCALLTDPANREINGLPAAIRRFIGRRANFALISA